jgi:hypothetical protein
MKDRGRREVANCEAQTCRATVFERRYRRPGPECKKTDGKLTPRSRPEVDRPHSPNVWREEE